MTIYISYGELHIIFIFMGWERECVMGNGSMIV